MLLQLILRAYAQGIVSSRAIERLCQEHVTFIALCGDQAPDHTTLARFISTLGADIARVFAAVLAICDAQGLIGREMFAIDGVKLPSNASKRRSATRAEFERHAAKLEAAAAQLLARHRAADGEATEPTLEAKRAQRVTRLQRDAAQLRTWLYGADYEQIVLAARGVAVAAEPNQAALVAAGLHPGFLTDLRAAADRLVAVTGERAQEIQRRVAATKGVESATTRGLAKLKLLDALARPSLRQDAPRLAEWERVICRTRSSGGATPVAEPQLKDRLPEVSRHRRLGG